MRKAADAACSVVDIAAQLSGDHAARRVVHAQAGQHGGGASVGKLPVPGGGLAHTRTATRAAGSLAVADRFDRVCRAGGGANKRGQLLGLFHHAAQAVAQGAAAFYSFASLETLERAIFKHQN